MDRTNAALRPGTRRLVQLYAALLHNAYLRGFITGDMYRGQAKYACAPGLNCYSCPGAVGACPLGALQNALASAGHRAGWYVLGMLVLFGVILGRTICGWLCPMGMMQELFYKIPTPKIRKGPVTRALTLVKYGILLTLVMAVPLWFGLRYDLPLPAFCKFLCPAGTLEGAVGHLANPANASMFTMLGALFTNKWVVLVLVCLACVFCFRAFCRFLCPLGAIYGLFNRFTAVGVQVDGKRCTGCGACVSHCGMDVKRIGDRECIQCGACMRHCAAGAISMKAGKLVLMGRDQRPTPKAGQRGRLLWGVAWMALLAALLWFNLLDPSIKTSPQPASDAPIISAESWASDAPVGYDVGCQLADFSLTCYDGAAFHLADRRGKVVFLNLWATWCTPCKGELPWFSDFAAAHGDDVNVLAVHPSMVVDDPETYVADKGFSLAFATDTQDDLLWRTVGGSGTLPQTIVLNRRGEVVYNAVGSVTPELLEALYQEAAQ